MSNGIVVTFNIWYILIPILVLVVFFSRNKIIKWKETYCKMWGECRCGYCHPELSGSPSKTIPPKCSICSDQGIVKTKLDILKNGRLVKQTVEIPCSCRKRREWDRLLKKVSK